MKQKKSTLFNLFSCRINHCLYLILEGQCTITVLLFLKKKTLFLYLALLQTKIGSCSWALSCFFLFHFLLRVSRKVINLHPCWCKHLQGMKPQCVAPCITERKSPRLLGLPDSSQATSTFLRAASRWACGRPSAISGHQSVCFSFCRYQFGPSSWRCSTPTTTMRASRKPARTRGSVQPGVPVSQGSPGGLPKCRRSGKRRRMFCFWTLGTNFRGQFGLITTKAQKPRTLWTNSVMMQW